MKVCQHIPISPFEHRHRPLLADNAPDSYRWTSAIVRLGAGVNSSYWTVSTVTTNQILSMTLIPVLADAGNPGQASREVDGQSLQDWLIAGKYSTVSGR